MNFKKGIATVALMAIGVRAALAVGANPSAREWLSELAENKGLMTASLSLEFGGREPEKGLQAAPTTEEENAEREKPRLPRESLPPFPSEVKIPKKEKPPEDKKIVVLPTTIAGGMVLSNDTSFKVDLEALVSQGPSTKLPTEGMQVLIIHTHGSEAFSPDATSGEYMPTDSFRSSDTRYNIVRVGDEITACLESYGISVLHDREIYDYPSYTGSYARSGAAIEKHLAEHPEIAIVLDVHRDAIGTDDVIYKTVAEANGQPCSQLMLLAGTGENGLAHPNWQENLKLALYLQSAVIEKHPTLARPIALKKERYNQQLTQGSLILEVGSSGNTLSEVLCAARLFAESVAPKLLELRNL
ncbi:MAG: stage II sporulation protein P [Oscillospiraceae bacterium]